MSPGIRPWLVVLELGCRDAYTILATLGLLSQPVALAGHVQTEPNLNTHVHMFRHGGYAGRYATAKRDHVYNTCACQ